MNIPDIIPISDLSQIYYIRLEIIIPLIFIFGYFTIRRSVKKGTLPEIKNAIDEIFLISASGSIWFIRLCLLNTILYSFSVLPEFLSTTHEEANNFPLIWTIFSWLFFLSLLFIISFFEILTIEQKKIQFFTKKRNFKLIQFSCSLGFAFAGLVRTLTIQPQSELSNLFWAIVIFFTFLISYGPWIHILNSFYKKYLYF